MGSLSAIMEIGESLNSHASMCPASSTSYGRESSDWHLRQMTQTEVQRTALILEGAKHACSGIRTLREAKLLRRPHTTTDYVLRAQRTLQ